MKTAVLLLCLASAAAAGNRIATIDFFGYKGIDLEAVRKALPVKEGDEAPENIKDQIREAVRQVLGKGPTDVARVCCDSEQRLHIFIGLPGASSRTFRLNAAPKGSERLPKSAVALAERYEKAFIASINKGQFREDDSRGYALFQGTREIQLEIRSWALQHDALLKRVVAQSSDVEHRRIASEFLGYAYQNGAQVRALVSASRDPDDEVRNNATRALSVLRTAKRPNAAGIPAAPFVEMVNSGIWSDRNKASALLNALTESKDPVMLTALRAGALEALKEIAAWRSEGHASFAQAILERLRYTGAEAASAATTSSSFSRAPAKK